MSEQADKVDASINNGTFYFVDLPVPLPLLNIRRLVGTTGVFILFSFVFSLLFSLAKGILKKMNIYLPLVSDKTVEQKAAEQRQAEQKSSSQGKQA